MTTPNPISEILEALENSPELEAALRQRILTREVLALPEQLTQLTATVADMARVFDERLAALESKQDATDARFDGVDTRLDGIDARLDGIDTRLDAIDVRLDGIDTRLDAIDARLDGIDTRLEDMTARQDAMQGQLNNLTGSDYERQAVRRAPRLVRRYLGVQSAEVLVAINRQNGRAITDLINDAALTGTITEEDADDLDRADIIMRGSSPDGDGVYVVAEVSITIDETDVDRANQRARILHNASGAMAHAAVIGTSISDANRERAHSSNVAVITLID